MAKQEEMAGIVAEVPGGKRSKRVAVGFQHPLRVYAARIWPEKRVDNSVRTLKRWVSVGKKADPVDLPPFDEMELLAEWFERHHTWKAADELVELRDGKPSPPEKTPAAKVAGPSGDDDEEIALDPMILDLDAEMTFDQGMKQIRSLVSATFAQMQKALAGGQMKQYRALYREWSTAATQMRQWEKDLTKIQEGRGEVLRTRVINSELVQIFTALGQSFFNALVNQLAVHSPEMPAEERWRVAIGARDKVFAHLNQTRFASAWEESNEFLDPPVEKPDS